MTSEITIPCSSMRGLCVLVEVLDPRRDEDFDMVVLVRNELFEALVDNVIKGNSAGDHFGDTIELS